MTSTSYEPNAALQDEYTGCGPVATRTVVEHTTTPARTLARGATLAASSATQSEGGSDAAAPATSLDMADLEQSLSVQVLDDADSDKDITTIRRFSTGRSSSSRSRE